MMSGSKCLGCTVCAWIKVIVYALVTLITLYAAYNTHFLPDGTFIAGAPEGSLALLTVIFSFHMLMKSLKKICGCGGCCGSSCGSACGCGTDACNCGDMPMKK